MHADTRVKNQQALETRTVVLCAIAGLFACFALRELRIGDLTAFWARSSHMMVFSWGVFGVAFWRTWRSPNASMMRNGDLAIVFLIALSAIPLAAESSLAGLGLCVGAMGAFVSWHGRHDPDLKAAGVCLLALFANFSLSPLVFRLGYSTLIGVDMALLQAAVDLTGAPVSVTPAGIMADDGLQVMLVGACSSFMGVSSAVLVHMGWAMAVRTDVGWRDAVAVAATIIVATLLNVIRLTLTASGYDGYAFWHGAVGETPLGGQIFWFAQNAVLLSGGYLSAYWAGRPDRARKSVA